MPAYEGRGGWIGAWLAPRARAAAPRRSWGDFYDGAVDEAYVGRHVGIHAPYLEAIRAARPSRALEAGCGSGIFSETLAASGSAVTALDLDGAIVRSVRQRAPAVACVQGDLFRLPFPDRSFDLSFSQGVFEHFPPARIRAAVAEQLRVARTVVFSVPNLWYRWGEYGNERLYSLEAWRGILSALPVVRLEEYHRVRLRRNLGIPRAIMTLGVLVRS